MRRSREDAARTRRDAVRAASALFREQGIDAVGVGDVMAALGMTAGGFYRHFAAKEALAAEACASAFAESWLSQAEVSPGSMVRGYLSRAHRDGAAAGCPMPALASEMPRQPPAVRRAYTEGVRQALGRIGQLAPDTDPETRMALLAGMVGALALARALDDEDLSSLLLRAPRRFWTRALAKGRRRS